MNPAPDKELECLTGNREIETALTEPGEFFSYGEQRDFALSVRGKRFEDDLLIEASDQFRAKEFVQFGNDSALQRRKGRSRNELPLT